MTDEYILQLAAMANYAHLYIDRSHSIGCGQKNWQVQLPQLTGSQRSALIAKLNRWQSMLSRERSRVS
jgi:hypothetical protein